MEKIHPTSALYIKLGGGGKKEDECLKAPGTLWAAWNEIDHDLCLAGDWEAVAQKGKEIYYSTQSAATNQAHQLRYFYMSGEDVLWITFFKEYLYWCFAEKEITLQADKSKVRKAINGWHCADINGSPLKFSTISGSILQTQRFSGTICSFTDDELSYLTMKINGEELPEVTRANKAKSELTESLQDIISRFHYKEFELLVDMIFREAGWQRVGELGGTRKDIDIELYSPIAQETYIVQVKASAGMEEYDHFFDFMGKYKKYHRYYLVVNNPSKELAGIDKNCVIRCWFAKDIADMVVTYGLVNWVIGKAK